MDGWLGEERGREGRELGTDEGSGGPDGDTASMGRGLGEEEAADEGEGEGEADEPTGDDKYCGWLLIDSCEGALIAAAVLVLTAAGEWRADSSGGAGSSGLYAV